MNFLITKNLREFSEVLRGDNQIWTGDQGVADPCLTTWLCRHAPRVGLEPTTTRLTAECSTIELSRMTPTGIEPVLPPWKGDVLTAWPWSHKLHSLLYAVLRNLYPQNRTLKLSLTSSSWITSTPSYLFRISPRPISKCQLNTLLCLHLIPIYLILSKGSYLLGYLILRGASRLDAFSVYPCRTWLLCHRIDS